MVVFSYKSKRWVGLGLDYRPITLSLQLELSWAVAKIRKAAKLHFQYCWSTDKSQPFQILETKVHFSLCYVCYAWCSEAALWLIFECFYDTQCLLCGYGYLAAPKLFCG